MKARFDTQGHERLSRELCGALEALIDGAAELATLIIEARPDSLPAVILARRLLRTDEALRELRADVEMLRHALAGEPDEKGLFAGD